MQTGSLQTVTGICEHGKKSLLFREGFLLLDELGNCQLREVSLVHYGPYIFAVMQSVAYNLVLLPCTPSSVWFYPLSATEQNIQKHNVD